MSDQAAQVVQRRPGLLIGCLRGPNAYFRSDGGRFMDATEELGLHQRVFNTRGIAAFDINGDGAPDAVFVNEGQDPTALLGNPERRARRGAAGQESGP